MYIAPNSEIYILKDVPIEPNYNHTLYFSSIEEQTAYFTTGNKVLFHLTNYSRIKITENEIKVELPVDRLYNANYIAFRNTAFGSKFFYAFVTNVEYINNVTTRLTYTLDVVQTWFFEHSLGQCFVVREHSATDEPGDNLQPENFELGEYIYEEKPREAGSLFSRWSIWVCSSYDARNGTNVTGGMIQGMYSGLQWFKFETAEEANNFIIATTDSAKEDAIVCVIMLPTAMAAGSEMPEIQTRVPVSYYPNGYVPKNKKLCTAPYTQIMVTDFMGHAAKYAYEYFDKTNWSVDQSAVVFNESGAISTVPQFICTPLDYKGLNKYESNYRNYHESLIISEVPQCPYTIDGFRAWQALWSNKVGFATELTSGLVDIGVSAIDLAVPNSTMKGKNKLPGPTYDESVTGLRGLVDGAAQVAGAIAKVRDASMLPAQAKSIGGGSAVFQFGQYGFHYIYTFIREEYAEIIDSFFNMYGYATNRVKEPIVRNHPSAMRPYWNYVKVLNCKINGSIPVEYESMLHDIYENGITFWSTPWDVGNYTYDNSPRGG